MKQPYDASYDPAFPAVQAILRNDEEGRQTSPAQALLDTGADGSLVPVTYLRNILAPALTETRISSHWGEWRTVQLFLVDLELNGLQLPGVFVVGDELGDQIILGRNVLNKLRLLLDGPDSLSEVLL